MCIRDSSWGWARFLPEQLAVQIVKILKPLNIPFQAFTLFFEFGVLFLLIDPHYATVIILGTLLMHILIFLCTGILFWEYILTNLLLVILIQFTSTHILVTLFSWESFLLFGGLTILLPFLKQEVWRPFGLGWWDTGYAGRIHWEVIGESGKVYGLYNNFMDPHERLFGRIYGYFFLNKKLIYRHIGEVESYEEQQAVLQAAGERALLEDIEKQYGKNYFDPDKIEAHDRYLRTFFQHFNAGKQKYILPARLHFLKPWGGQYYYWGDLDAFTGQEKVTQCRLWFRSSYFKDNHWKEIENTPLHTIHI